MPRTLLVYCTCPDGEPARALATALVAERLAACVNRLAVDSVYRWEGAVEQAAECLLIIKTTVAGYPALAGRIRDLHPYELPEIIAVPISDGLPEYLEWVADSVSSD